jgi:hypothetical protein
MRTWLQHFFHPRNLWCRCGGNFTTIFRLYEAWCWQPLLRRLLANGPLVPQVQTADDFSGHWTTPMRLTGERSRSTS